MSLKVQNFLFLVVFVSLSTITSNILWNSYSWRILPQMLLIILIALVGEHLVSSQGYYYYTRHERNGPFLRNIPMWIIFLWIFLIQASYIVSLLIGLNGLSACLFSGWFASLIDFLFLEPLMSRMMGLWLWTPVEKGYFGFIPSRFNRFTAPPGNYITWLLFPILANCFLGIILILL
jgi:hypothetical protein